MFSKFERMTTNEVAKLIGITVDTLAVWRCRGRGPRYTKIPGVRGFYLKSDVEAWFATGTVRAGGR
jgi:hypothetical protein